MSEAKLVSPNELYAAAREMMLEGREVETWEDAMNVLNFMAANIAKGLKEPATKLIRKLYPELERLTTESDATMVAKFQEERS